MKKMVRLALALAMACAFALALAGCGGSGNHADLVTLDGAFSYDARFFDVEANNITVEDYVRVNPNDNDDNHVVYAFITIRADESQALKAPKYEKDKYGIAGPKVKCTDSNGNSTMFQDLYNANNTKGKFDKYFNPVGYYSAYPGWHGSDTLAAGSGKSVHVVFAIQVPNKVLDGGGQVEIQYGDFPVTFDASEIVPAYTLSEMANRL